MKDEDDEVDAREGAWSMETAMVLKVFREPDCEHGHAGRFGCEGWCSRNRTGC